MAQNDKRKGRSKRPVADPDQSQRFIRTARELGCDEGPEAFERVFARVVPPKKRPETPTVEKAGVRKKRRLTGRKQGAR